MHSPTDSLLKPRRMFQVNCWTLIICNAFIGLWKWVPFLWTLLKGKSKIKKGLLPWRIISAYTRTRFLAFQFFKSFASPTSALFMAVVRVKGKSFLEGKSASSQEIIASRWWISAEKFITEEVKGREITGRKNKYVWCLSY